MQNLGVRGTGKRGYRQVEGGRGREPGRVGSLWEVGEERAGSGIPKVTGTEKHTSLEEKFTIGAAHFAHRFSCRAIPH